MAGKTEPGFDLIIVGSGPGGYVAAIRASQLGMRVACVETEALGGVCLNIGCIPTKALLTSASLVNEMREGEKHGILATDVTYDLGPAQQRSRRVADQMRKGVGHLFKKNGVTHVEGFGRLKGPGKVEVEAADGNKTVYEAPHVIIATGSRPRDLPTLKIDEDRIWSSTGALMHEKAPGSLFIVRNMPGAGHIIGLNYIYNSKPDGLTLGTFNTGMFLNQILEKKGVKFDMTKMNYLGKLASSYQILMISNKQPYRSIADLQKSGKVLKMATGGPGSSSTALSSKTGIMSAAPGWEIYSRRPAWPSGRVTSSSFTFRSLPE